MQSKATAREVQSTNVSAHRSAKYQKVYDARKQPIRGLWERNGKYIARLAIEQENGEKVVKRIPLDGATTPAEAHSALKKIQTKRADGETITTGTVPTFRESAKRYFEHCEAHKGQRKYSEGTIQKEKAAVDVWIKEIGGVRINRVSKSHIIRFREKMKQEGLCNRTLNLYVIALRNVLWLARAEDKILLIPHVDPLEHTPRKRALFTHEELERICTAAGEVTKNAQDFSDYMQFMAYSGARRNEALAVSRSDIDWKQEQVAIVSIKSGGNTRYVPFNGKLKALLLDMKQRWAPDCKWLFPSPQRGEKDIHAKSFRESLELARAKAKLPHIGFHDCRHLFISYCVMSGIDYMTIAEWVGHVDGGVLIGKVYGHLADEHKKKQAEKLVFAPSIVAA